ncbi:tetratricopeptide repeat protein [candidate division WWE3 bacterium]|uniref:Tetratricopeptide repeat protein n=1 Tax=candidate division WWE3 bacterium TaxID=2053526 RepID=A0A955IX92_UNCKA|nr:tetratricopeptide repeat protein [candidate division WWE3 bacterium]
MNERPAKLFDKLITSVTSFVALMMPLFFLPITSDYFEYNKQALLISFTLFLLFVTAFKILYTKNVNFIKSSLNPAILFFIVVFALASFFSISKTASIYGNYGRWFPSLLGILVTALCYYALVLTDMTKQEVVQILIFLLIGTTISTLTALLAYFDLNVLTSLRVPYGTQFAGSTSNSAILAAFAVVFSAGIYPSIKLLPIKLLTMLTIAVNLALLVLFNILSAWAFLAVGSLLILLITSRAKTKMVFKAVLPGTLVAIVLTIGMMSPNTKELLAKPDFPKDLKSDGMSSWVVASKTITDFPVLGTGPATYNLNYTRYRPVYINNTNLWNIRMDKPYNEVYNLMATLGIAGVIAFIFIAQRTIKAGTESILAANENTEKLVATLMIAMAITYVFTYANILNSFMLMLFTALTTIMAVKNSGVITQIIELKIAAIQKAPKNVGTNTGLLKSFHVFAAIPVLAVALLGSILFYRAYAAEYYFAGSIKAFAQGDGVKMYLYQQKAISYAPTRAEYRNAYAQTNMLIAQNMSAQEEPTEEESSIIQNAITEAVNQVKTSTEVLDPLNANSWELRATIFKQLLSVAKDADTLTIQAYENAIRLDPNSPRLRLDLGNVYFSQEKYLEAANLFRQAANLKGDYANAHYNLAQALEKIEKYDLAKTEYEITKRLVQPDSEDYNMVVAAIEALPEPQVAGTSDEKPTVEELTTQEPGPNNETQVTLQEPLKDPVLDPSIELDKVPTTETN